MSDNPRYISEAGVVPAGPDDFAARLGPEGWANAWVEWSDDVEYRREFTDPVTGEQVTA